MNNAFLNTLTKFNHVVGDRLADIAQTKPPKTPRDHLLALFMTTTEFYNGDGSQIPQEQVTLLNDMYRCTRKADGAHALELMRAIHVLSHCPALRNDPAIRLAISDANVALLQVVL